MISKVFLTGKGFRETCKYVCEDLNRAEVLSVKGVRSYSYEFMAEDFNMQHGYWPEKEKPVFHAALSFPKNEQLSNEQLVAIAKDYLDIIGLSETQYAIVRHKDREHCHVHLIANRIDDSGEITGKGLIVERGIKAARQLTERYGLQPEKGKAMDLTNLDALHEPDAKRYRLYLAIQEVLPGARTFDEFRRRLVDRNIMLKIREDRWTGEQQGISFRIEGLSFAGKRVDEAFSLGNLNKELSRQRELDMKQELKEDCGLSLERGVKLSQDGELNRSITLAHEKVREQIKLQEEMEERPRRRQQLRLGF